MGGPSNREITFLVKMRNEAKAAMREVGSDFRDMATRAKMAGRDARRGMDQIQAGAARASLGVRALGAAMMAIPFVAIIAAITATARALLSSGDAYTGLENRLLSTGTAAEHTRDQLRRLNQIARDSDSALEPTVALYGRAAQAIGDLGGSTAEAERFTLTWNRAMVAGGASTAEAASATLQFSQALGSNVLRGEEYNAIAEASPFILRKMAEALGVTVGELRQMAQEGKLTGQVLRGVMADMAVSVDDVFGQAARRADVAWANFVDNLKFRIGEIADSLGSSGGLAGLIDQGTEAVDVLAVTLTQTLGPAFQLAGEVARTFLEFTGIQAMIDMTREWAGETAQVGEATASTGAIIVGTIRAALINTREYLKWGRENFDHFVDYLGRIFHNVGNSIVRSFDTAFGAAVILAKAAGEAMQGHLTLAASMSASAWQVAFNAANARYPDINPNEAFRGVEMPDFVSTADEVRRVQEAFSGTSVGLPTGGSSPRVQPGAGTTTDAERARAARDEDRRLREESEWFEGFAQIARDAADAYAPWISQRQEDLELGRRLTELRHLETSDRETFNAVLDATNMSYEEYVRLQERANLELNESRSLWDEIRLGAMRTADELKSSMSLMEEAVGTTIDRLGDAFKRFVTTGKLDFKDLVATILAELAQMAAARAWQEMLSVIGGSGSTTGGSTGSTGGSSSNFWADAAMFIASMFHDGGIVGSQVKAARSISPTVFAHAKRYHRGGMAGLSSGEVPIIAKRGEAVMPTVRLPNGQLGVQAMGGAGTTVISPTYNVTNNISGAGKDSAEISDEVAAKTLEGLQKNMRGIAQDEIRKANTFGGQSNWRP